MIFRSVIAPWNAFGGNPAYCENGNANISANKTWPTSKATWRVLQQISADTKDLDDIPHDWPQAQAFDLPAVQYTAPDVRSGLLFWAFAQRRSASASALFAARIQQHLERCGVTLRDLVWQTDNGVFESLAVQEFHRNEGMPFGFAPSSSGATIAAVTPPVFPLP